MSEAHNPLCGDEITISARLLEDSVSEVKWEGLGCSILYASADLMADATQGHGRAETIALIDDVVSMLHGVDTGEELGELTLLRAMQRYPSRLRCAELPWQTLRGALAGRPEPLA